MDPRVALIAATLPGRDCGQCGFRTCAGLAELISREPAARARCVHLNPAHAPAAGIGAGAGVALAEDHWQDILGRGFDMVLEPFAEDPGPREHILPFNPALAERLRLRKGQVLVGRPAGVGCPVTHVGELMADPDSLSGALVWCVVGQIAGRDRGIEIGHYHIVAYEGLVRRARVEPRIGARHFFKPSRCMIQSRHSGVISALLRRPDGWQVRFEGIWIA